MAKNYGAILNPLSSIRALAASAAWRKHALQGDDKVHRQKRHHVVVGEATPGNRDCVWAHLGVDIRRWRIRSNARAFSENYVGAHFVQISEIVCICFEQVSVNRYLGREECDVFDPAYFAEKALR